MVAVTDARSTPSEVATTATFTSIVVSPHDQRRESLVRQMSQCGGRSLGACDSGHAAARRSHLYPTPDVAVIDGSIHDAAVLPLVAHLRHHHWARIVLLSSTRDPRSVGAAVVHGVRSLVVIPAVRFGPADSANPASEAAESLTDREVEVLQLVSEGNTNKETGAALGLSSLTVKSHLARIARKLGTGDRAHMVSVAFRAGLLR